MSLHDYRLVSLIYSAAKVVTLVFVAPEGSRVEVTLSGIRAFIANALADGNIVLDAVDTAISRQPTQAVVARLAEFFQVPGAASVPCITDAERDALCDAVQRGALTLFWVEPTYGARLACVCERVTYAERPSSETV